MYIIPQKFSFARPVWGFRHFKYRIFESHEILSHLLSASLPTHLVTGPFSTIKSDKK